MAIEIPTGAHHYDLFGAHPNDTQEIIDIRSRMKDIVKGWIQSASSEAIAAQAGSLPTAPPFAALPAAVPPFAVHDSFQEPISPSFSKTEKSKKKSQEVTPTGLIFRWLTPSDITAAKTSEHLLLTAI